MPPRLVGVALCWLVLAGCAVAARLRSEAAAISSAGYLIASFPNTQQVNYARLPDAAWFPLVPKTGITSPEALAIDPVNKRLFVADPPVGLVYWYKLSVMDDGRLITEGTQHLAASSISAAGLSCDSVGSLYISGQLQGATSMYGIFKQDAAAFANDIPPVPPPIWTQANSNLSGFGVQLQVPGGIAVDPFHVYWGNAIAGQQRSSVVQAASAAPNMTLMQAKAYQDALQVALHPLADNAREVRGLALTPEGIVYATPSGVYGVHLSNAGKGCGPMSQHCPLIAAMQDPTSLVWDGDGTVLVADRADGRVYCFPSGTIQQHPLQKVTDAPGIFGLALFQGGEAKDGSGSQGSDGGVVGWLLGSS